MSPPIIRRRTTLGAELDDAPYGRPLAKVLTLSALLLAIHRDRSKSGNDSTHSKRDKDIQNDLQLISEKLNGA